MILFHCRVYEGAKNNLPDEIARHAAVEIYNLASSCTEKDILLVLMSGGGSALLPLPAPPLSLEDKFRGINILSQAGASIKQLNTLRKNLSLVKGGRLAQAAYPAQVSVAMWQSLSIHCCFFRMPCLCPGYFIDFV